MYRQVAGYPEALRPGIAFSAKRLLRFAIILYGLKLNIDIVLHQGLFLLLRDAGTIVFAIVAMVLLARLFKADASLSLLLGVGTGVCGAAAIAAVSPILRADEEDTAIGAGIIALMGTVFAIAYTLIRPLLPLTNMQYGVWSGVSIHEIAQVALAAAPAGHDALAIALLAKLGRVFLLVPLSFIFVFIMKARGAHDPKAKIEFPWFLIGFIAMSLVGSYVLGKWIIVPAGGDDDHFERERFYSDSGDGWSGLECQPGAPAYAGATPAAGDDAGVGIAVRGDVLHHLIGQLIGQ